MDINANIVRELREKTGAGVMDCKKALAEASGDLEKAIVWLREKRYRAGRQARRQARLGGLGRVLHPCGRQARRAGRGQLRERLRGQDARVPDPGQGDRDADRGGQSALRQPRGRARRSYRAGAPDLRHAVGGQARSGDQEDRRRQAGKVLPRHLSQRAGLGARSQPHHHRPAGRIRSQAGREDRNPPLRPLPARRIARRQHGLPAHSQPRAGETRAMERGRQAARRTSPASTA